MVSGSKRYEHISENWSNFKGLIGKVFKIGVQIRNS